jgi:hypothetical protein
MRCTYNAWACFKNEVVRVIIFLSPVRSTTARNAIVENIARIPSTMNATMSSAREKPRLVAPL